MTDDRDEGDDTEDSHRIGGGIDVGGSIPLGDVFETLSELLDRIEDADLDAAGRRSDSVRRDDVRFDYDVNVGTIDPGGESRGKRRRRDWDIRGASEDREYRVQVDESDGELVVTADLPAVSADDVEVGTDDRTGALEIRVDGEVVESIPLDWDGAKVTDVSFNNRILEVHVEPPAEDGERGDGTDDPDGSDDGRDPA